MSGYSRELSRHSACLKREDPCERHMPALLQAQAVMGGAFTTEGRAAATAVGIASCGGITGKSDSGAAPVLPVQQRPCARKQRRHQRVACILHTAPAHAAQQR
jgi:hypothetical protein